jgi:hypothetical protein
MARFEPILEAYLLQDPPKALEYKGSRVALGLLTCRGAIRDHSCPRQ